MRVAELRAEARARGLSTEGTKKELVERLRGADTPPAAGAADIAATVGTARSFAPFAPSGRLGTHMVQVSAGADVLVSGPKTAEINEETAEEDADALDAALVVEGWINAHLRAAPDGASGRGASAGDDSEAGEGEES